MLNVINKDSAMTKSLGMIIALTVMLVFIWGCQPEKEDSVVVKEGETILVLEAMKMESPVKAPKDCKIIAIEVAVGDNVKNGDTLAMIE